MTPKHYFQFGPFRVDLLTHRLLRDGEVVALQPKAFDTLVVLLQNQGRVVERAVLMKTLWPDSFVEEANLTQYVFTLRKALGEQPNGQPYIETVPRRGYLFAADAPEIRDAGEVESGVTLRTPDAESRGDTRSHEPATLTQGRTARLLIFTAVVVGALIVAAGWIWLRPRSVPVPTPEYVQLTNYADSATSPALSPDGRMLVFLRGADTFRGPAEVYVKLLPDGPPFQLTHDDVAKMSPVFSPDGARIAYTTVDRGRWDTWAVPIPGGTPQRLLPNASGLSWIADHRVMFSEMGPGMYMRIATATESRAEEHDVYRPPASELSMAHRSYLSPDHKSVLVAEMDPHGWMPCRVVPVNSSPGRQVGPLPGKCTTAAWSPDGRWMYFSANAGKGFHIWRQRFPDGDPEQITFGATEEEGIAMAPSGRSLITSVGLEQSNVWLHDPAGDRQITSEGYAYTPAVSPDSSKVYYLVRSGSSRAFVAGELWVADVSSPSRERLLPGFLITRYDISADGKRVAFAVTDASEKSSLWLAPLDGRSPPRPLTSLEASRPFFGPAGDVFFMGKEGKSQYVYRAKEGSTLSEKIVTDPIIYLIAVSPDGQWLVAWIAYGGDESTQALVAYPTRGGPKRLVCSACAISGPYNPGGPLVSWSRDQKSMFFKSIFGGMDHNTFVMPLRSGEALATLPRSGFQSHRDVLAAPGAWEIAEQDVFPGSSSSVYAFTRKTTRRNLYSIPVP